MTTAMGIAAWLSLVTAAALVVRHRAIQRAMRDHPELRTDR